MTLEECIETAKMDTLDCNDEYSASVWEYLEELIIYKKALDLASVDICNITSDCFCCDLYRTRFCEGYTTEEKCVMSMKNSYIEKAREEE